MSKRSLPGEGLTQKQQTTATTMITTTRRSAPTTATYTATISTATTTVEGSSKLEAGVFLLSELEEAEPTFLDRAPS